MIGYFARARHWAFQKGIFSSQPLPASTIAIGNISLGGTGKSPMVAFLADKFLKDKKRVLVLSRGYKRRDKNPFIRPPFSEKNSSTLPNAAKMGDEPYMLWRRHPSLGFVVAADRGRVARENWDKLAAELVILDDAFQHHAVARDLDIVMLDATENPHTATLPFGRRRESLAALERADILVLHRVNEVSSEALAKWRLALFEFPQPLFQSQVMAKRLVAARTGQSKLASTLQGKEIILICGVAKPESVAHTFRMQGAHICAHLYLPDHADFSLLYLKKIRDLQKQFPKALLVFTEKDAARWESSIEEWPTEPYFLQTDLTIDKENEFWQILEAGVRRA